jgi:hypothetical protein
MSDKLCDRCYRAITDPASHGVGLCPFERRRELLPSKGFEPRFDIGLGRYVTGWGDIHRGMREERLDFRDHPSPGARSARLDKCNEARKARRKSRGQSVH